MEEKRNVPLMFLLMFRLISKEPYIDKTRIGVYGKVRRTCASFIHCLIGLCLHLLEWVIQ